MTASAQENPGGSGSAKAGVQRLLTALVKIALVGDAMETGPWRAEALEALRELRKLVAVPALNLDAIWTVSVRAAERDPKVRRGETVNPTLPAMSPLRADQLGTEPFDIDGAVQTIRDTASFG